MHLPTLNPLIAVAVVAATAATDAVYVRFTSAVVARRPLPAANWSGLWYLLSSFAVISYTDNWVYVCFAALGSWIGAFVSLTFLQGPPGRGRGDRDRAGDAGRNRRNRQKPVRQSRSENPTTPNVGPPTGRPTSRARSCKQIQAMTIRGACATQCAKKLRLRSRTSAIKSRRISRCRSAPIGSGQGVTVKWLEPSFNTTADARIRPDLVPEFVAISDGFADRVGRPGHPRG